MVRRHRKAFTLIEILVVIGIILVLIGIGVIGFQHLDKVASEKATKANLETCNSILTEYQSNAGTLNLIEGNTNAFPKPIYATGAQVGNPGDVNLGSLGRLSGAVATTAQILQLCARIPQAKTILSQIPSSSMLTVSSGNPPSEVLLDAWKNPIIYVPSGGLGGVTSGGRSVAVYSVDGRPFWASAGQDGNFGTGDDNIYSTQVIMK